MRAIIIPKFGGGPELLEKRDVERSEPGPGEVLVRVFASSANPVATKLRVDGSFAGLGHPRGRARLHCRSGGRRGLRHCWRGTYSQERVQATHPFGRLAIIISVQGDLI